MFWVFINAIGIAIAGTFGMILNKFISKKQGESLILILGLLIIVMGIQGALEINSMLLMLVSLTIGTFIGTTLKMHDRTENLANKFSSANVNSDIIKNAITIIIIQCSGSLSILAAMNMSLKGDPSLLQFKTILDSVSGLIFASVYGVSIYIAAFALFIYQGSIYLLTNILGNFLTPEVINEFSAIGSVLLIGMGLGLMKIKDFKTLDYLPAMFIPIVWYGVQSLFGFIF
ncbi:MAG: DUF554 domain-containing protein [Miniphocaeibacter sp.]|uniref:DUF554 domain-containing protein n=1 Tax=Miniphocaeibacter sp. TaxID=3100973 RepID=UPI00185927A7|nr:DUF554 domain-containing protein [Gallicola sp.]